MFYALGMRIVKRAKSSFGIWGPRMNERTNERMNERTNERTNGRSVNNDSDWHWNNDGWLAKKLLWAAENNKRKLFVALRIITLQSDSRLVEGSLLKTIVNRFSFCDQVIFVKENLKTIETSIDVFCKLYFIQSCRE